MLVKLQPGNYFNADVRIDRFTYKTHTSSFPSLDLLLWPCRKCDFLVEFQVVVVHVLSIWRYNDPTLPAQDYQSYPDQGYADRSYGEHSYHSDQDGYGQNYSTDPQGVNLSYSHHSNA